MSAKKVSPAKKTNVKIAAPISKGSKLVTAQKQTSSKVRPVALFGKNNFYLMLVGLGLLIIGFLLMTGATEKSPTEFDASVIYSFRRITLAPIVLILGFVVEIFAIMRKPRQDADTSNA